MICTPCIQTQTCLPYFPYQLRQTSKTVVFIVVFFIAIHRKNGCAYTVKSRMQSRDIFQLGKELEAFLQDLADLVIAGTEKSSISLDLFTEHKRFDQIYRGSPHYRGMPWRDWAMINWGNGVILPGQIWIFVDLHNIPEERSFHPKEQQLARCCKRQASRFYCCVEIYAANSFRYS